MAGQIFWKILEKMGDVWRYFKGKIGSFLISGVRNCNFLNSKLFRYTILRYVYNIVSLLTVYKGARSGSDKHDCLLS